MRRVGIDLGIRGPHRAVVFDNGEPMGQPFNVPHGKPGIDMLERRGLDGAETSVEFVMEPTGLAWLPLAAELARRGYRVFVPKPQKLHALRVFYSQHAKTDGWDAFAAAAIRHVDPRGVHQLRTPTAAQTTLRMFIKQRARLVDQAARDKTRIRSWLVLANPFLASALRHPFSAVGIAFLRRFVDPFAVRELGQVGLRDFWCEHSRSSSKVKQSDRVWQACQKACELYEALRASEQLPFDFRQLQLLVRQQLDQIEFLQRQVAELESEIERLYADIDPDRLLTEVPGVGRTVAPAIEAFAGDVERFSNVKQFASYCGLVPRSKQTGGGPGRSGQRLTKSGPNLLKQYLFLAAEVGRRYDPSLAAAYARAKSRGKHHYSAVTIVAHKLARKLFALLRQRARARRARAAGRQVEPVRYEYRLPDSDEAVSKAQARAYIQAHFRSGGTTKQQAAAAGVPKDSGSSSKEDATIGTTGSPQPSPLSARADHGKSVDNIVEKTIMRLRDKARTRLKRAQTGLDNT